jgi:hypothetical protein
MDQKEIDELLNKGNLQAYKAKQDEIYQNLTQKNTDLAATQPKKQGKVMGQLSRVSEEAEAGTNMVMNFLENIMTIVGKMKTFQKNTEDKLADPATTVDWQKVLHYYSDSVYLIEDLLFSAMDAFQFQDINRQKLMKVMYTLAKLNDYLNELLGSADEKAKAFGSDIENKSLEKDKDKEVINQTIDDYQHK